MRHVHHAVAAAALRRMTTLDRPRQISPAAFHSPGIGALPPIKFRPSTPDRDKPEPPERKPNAGSIRDISRDFLQREIHQHVAAELLAFAVLAGCSAVSTRMLMDALQQLAQ